MNYQITTTILGFVLAGAILFLVRRDHLHGPYAAWWLAVAVATVILGLQPTVIDWLAGVTRISYAPSLLFSLAIGFILLKMLKADIEASRHERRIRRLAQKMSILSEENRKLQRQIDEQHGAPGEQLHTSSDPDARPQQASSR